MDVRIGFAVEYAVVVVDAPIHGVTGVDQELQHALGELLAAILGNLAGNADFECPGYLRIGAFLGILGGIPEDGRIAKTVIGPLGEHDAGSDMFVGFT